MTVFALFLAGCVGGFVAGRWWSLGLGLAAGVATLGAGVVTGGRPMDDPALFVTLVATLGLAVGVAARRRIGSRFGLSRP